MNFFKTHSEKIFLLFGFVLILVAGFFSGYFYSQEKIDKQDIIIENPDENCADFFFKNPEIMKTKVKGDSASDREGSEMNRETGLFVASKNSKLYHKADCVYVKRIKDENKIFFNSKQEAEDRGLKLHSGE